MGKIAIYLLAVLQLVSLMKSGVDDKSTGTVFNILRFLLQDGPGISTTVFLKGCSLKFRCCRNLEPQAHYPEIRAIKYCTAKTGLPHQSLYVYP